MKHETDRLYMASNGITQPIGPETDEAWVEFQSLVSDEYGRLHSDDTFEDLKHRARFSKEDQGMLRDWMAIAAHHAEGIRSAS
ncbi:hypothetical protein IMCC20628_00072 [Hoeflea sp. IMCC20628]|uniref:hypothetical protein n=1 Tax=Hoeflea sp. IMCC20628 TaxID=1620421 RepID=UPI00063BE505|nr:hypothetical protein [Hoeflea sp. IMCC20628]AKH98808.1 hypothetical protein IMCC20628_00072 [Hoeflea sp. IMCC20628]